MEKQRLFYLDFVRAIAVVLILLTHYNARFLIYYMSPAQPDKAIVTLYPFGIYIGDLGVSIFFIISGAALMYVYEQRLEIKTYIKRRFQSIYPMFWMAYGICFLWLFWLTKQVPNGSVPRTHFILTILGVDGYLSSKCSTYYLLGEWFLGCIILLYAVFPLLRKLFLKNQIVFWIVVLVMYFPFAIRDGIWGMPTSTILMVRIPELAFGMFFVSKIKKAKPWMWILGLIVLIITTVINPPLPNSIKTTYIGVAAFVVLTALAETVHSPMIQGVCKTISKYSYSIFLTHHVIIDNICNTFPMETMGLGQRYLLFGLCCSIIAFVSYMLYHFHEKVVTALRSNPIWFR